MAWSKRQLFSINLYPIHQKYNVHRHTLFSHIHIKIHAKKNEEKRIFFSEPKKYPKNKESNPIFNVAPKECDIFMYIYLPNGIVALLQFFFGGLRIPVCFRNLYINHTSCVNAYERHTSQAVTLVRYSFPFSLYAKSGWRKYHKLFLIECAILFIFSLKRKKMDEKTTNIKIFRMARKKFEWFLSSHFKQI